MLAYVNVAGAVVLRLLFVSGEYLDGAAAPLDWLH